MQFSEKPWASYFHNAARGIDNEPVQETGEAESIGRIGTLKQDTRDLSFILQKTDELIEDIYKEVTEKELEFQACGNLRSYD